MVFLSRMEYKVKEGTSGLLLAHLVREIEEPVSAHAQTRLTVLTSVSLPGCSQITSVRLGLLRLEKVCFTHWILCGMAMGVAAQARVAAIISLPGFASNCQKQPARTLRFGFSQVHTQTTLSRRTLQSNQLNCTSSKHCLVH